MTADDLRVAAAAIFGAGSPMANWLINLGPVLNTLLTIGQIAVAVVTALYIYQKLRKAHEDKDDV